MQEIEKLKVLQSEREALKLRTKGKGDCGCRKLKN